MSTIKIIYSLQSFQDIGIKKANKKVGGTDHQKLKLKNQKKRFHEIEVMKQEEEKPMYDESK